MGCSGELRYRPQQAARTAAWPSSSPFLLDSMNGCSHAGTIGSASPGREGRSRDPGGEFYDVQPLIIASFDSAQRLVIIHRVTWHLPRARPGRERNKRQQTCSPMQGALDTETLVRQQQRSRCVRCTDHLPTTCLTAQQLAFRPDWILTHGIDCRAEDGRPENVERQDEVRRRRCASIKALQHCWCWYNSR